MQFHGKWWPGVAGLSAEDHVDGHSSDGLIVVVGDGDREAVEPVVIVIEWFAYLNVLFVLRLNGDNSYRLHGPRLSNYSPVLLLSLTTATR
jgi:hypothetical protein